AHEVEDIHTQGVLNEIIASSLGVRSADHPLSSVVLHSEQREESNIILPKNWLESIFGAEYIASLRVKDDVIVCLRCCKTMGRKVRCCDSSRAIQVERLYVVKKMK